MKTDNRFRGPPSARKALEATHVAPTPSKAPPRASLWTIEAFYGNVKLTGPVDQVNFVLNLIQEAENKQVRRSAKIE